MSVRSRRALLSDAEVEEIAQKAIDTLSNADKDDTGKDDGEGDKSPSSDKMEEILFSSDNRRTAMSVKNLIMASVATRGVFRKFAKLSDEEKDEVVKKVKDKMNVKDDEDTGDDEEKDTSEDEPAEEEMQEAPAEEPVEDADADADEDTSDDEDEDSDEDTEEVEEITDEEEPADEAPADEPVEEEPTEEVPAEEESDMDEGEQKDKIEEIVNGLVEEVQTIKQDGQVSQKEVVGLITNMMEMVNLLVQAKPPTRRRKKNAATREFEIAMRVAGDEIHVGEKVKYSRNFLRSIGEYGEMGHLTGTVRMVKSMGSVALAEVAWENGDVIKVNVRNLVPVSRLHLELASDRVAGGSRMMRYIVNTNDYRVYSTRWSQTHAEWRVNQYGSPTPQNIREYVGKYNASLEPDGVNSHLGRESAIYGAKIVDQTTGETVAEWSNRAIAQLYRAKPTFEVVE